MYSHRRPHRANRHKAWGNEQALVGWSYQLIRILGLKLRFTAIQLSQIAVQFKVVAVMQHSPGDANGFIGKRDCCTTLTAALDE